MEDMDLIKKFFEEYNFSEKEKEIIQEFNGREVELLYNCYINTDMEPTEENLYKIFVFNFIDEKVAEKDEPSL